MFRGILIVAATGVAVGAMGLLGGCKATVSSPVALGGAVSSTEEGLMEGVVVNARRDGATFTISVVSNSLGQFSFPRTHLAPGKYAVTIRAVGYDLIGPTSAEVTAGALSKLDLKLAKTRDLASQLSSLEWARSIPGTVEQKAMLLHEIRSCVFCHTLERIVKSSHTAEQFVSVITRMSLYFPDGTASSRDGRGRGQLRSAEKLASRQNSTTWGEVIPKTVLAAYLATLNLSGGKTTWPFELKTLPRPTGKATQVIVTQYDLPRADTVAHDLDIDSEGTPWYTDESRMFFGKMDPKTGVVTEYSLPDVAVDDVPGARDVQVDLHDNIWFPMKIPGGEQVLTRYNPKTKELRSIKGVSGRFLALGPGGKIWAGLTRVNPETMKVEASYTWADSPNMPPGKHGTYADVQGIDSKGNPYLPDIDGSHIIGIDTATKEARFWPLPTPNSSPRRCRMDADDRLWFGEYTGDRIGVFDTRTKKFQEWQTRYQYSTPYTASTPDRKGYVYAPSNTAERVIRLDPKTGEMVEYQMPTDFDSKKIAHDPTTKRSTLWMANTRNARIIKLEPLD